MSHQNQRRWRICLALACTVFQHQAAALDASLHSAKRVAEKSARAPIIARADFLAKPSVRGVSMSPDGRWLAYRRDTGQGLELWLRPIWHAADQRPGKDHRVMATSEGSEVHWSGDGARLWLPDATGLGVFELASMTSRRIVRFDEARRQAFWKVDRNAAHIAVLSEKVPAAGTWLYRYLAVDASGKMRLIHQSRQALKEVLLDAKGKLRYAAGHDGAAFDTVLWRSDGNDQQELMRCPLPQQCRPLAFNDDTLWALAHHGGTLMSLQRLDRRSTQWRTLHLDPRAIADGVSLLMQADTKDWFAMAYRPGRLEWHGRTPKANLALSTLQKKLAGSNLAIDPSNDGKRWLVQATRADRLGERYFLYDVATSTLSPQFADQDIGELATKKWAEVVDVHWRGKDGMRLHGVVYLPQGLALASAPLLAFIHGGPYARSLGEADPYTLLMVNRGYIVFKPNFRASTGYGVDYLKAARGNFGKHGVLDDIITGLDHLIAHHIGDAKRQAVLGHSFGGYASLLAVSHYPDRFVFAVPSAAAVDFAWTMAEVAIEGGSALSADGPPIEILLPGYGVPYGEQQWHQRMHRESPLARAAALRTPVYLWAGAKDDRVAVQSLVRYFAEANPNFTPTLLIDPDEGHNPRKRLSVEALAWLIEAAADRHFGGGVTPPSEALTTFLKKNLRNGAPKSSGR
jgi:dipeptidyl aminopeptidase/acylaminoacyl peptidase